ncbi:hypothetical protein L7F22_003873 [Adiantum nelumboides]|nr:hypothetical protein [Adiantum nelumboides]
MGNESSDHEGDALQNLLDAFPSAPLELIASAYIQAHSDQELAAEIITFSLDGISSEPSSNGVSSGAPDVSRSETSSKSSKPASHRYPLPRFRGPCPPTLEEYFPSSSEENAWIKPLSRLLQEDLSLQNQQTASLKEMQPGACAVEFPSLEKTSSNRNDQRLRCADIPQCLGSRSRSMSRASAAFGLVSSARSSTSRTADKDSLKQSKQSKQQAVKAEEASLWPTEAEASLLSMLGDDFNLDIEAVRDVLGLTITSVLR